MKPLPHEDALFTLAELAEAIGADLETIKNWVRRGIIRRALVGGRQMSNRLFSADAISQAAITYALVESGLAPSAASKAVKSIWEQCNKRDLFEHEPLYAILYSTNDEWTTVLCPQLEKGLSSPRSARSTSRTQVKAGFFNSVFVVVPISQILNRIAGSLELFIEASRERRVPR
jgi:hypothetical protein